MRLTTLARKIEITPNKLITFLEENKIELDNGIHSKLNEDIINLVFENFAPDQMQDQEITNTAIEEVTDKSDGDSIEEAVKETKDASEIEEPEQEEQKSIELVPEEIVIENQLPPIQDVKTGTIDDLEGESVEEIDLIKAKKVKLEGIKVVGKIDLPKKPEKEETADKNDEVDQADKKEETKIEPITKSQSFNRRRKKNRHKDQRKQLSYDEKLKEEKREKLKKRRRRENEEKRRKKKYYEQNIKPKIAQQPKQKKKKKQVESSPAPQNDVIVHKNPIRRLWAWLNGKYDKY